MKSGCLTYIIGVVAFGVAIGFQASNSGFNSISLLILLLFFVWAFAVPFILFGKAAKKARKPFEDLQNSPEITADVRVFGKTTKTSGGDTIPNGESGYYTAPVITSHFISFEFPDGIRKNFSVDVDQYNTEIGRAHV